MKEEDFEQHRAGRAVRVLRPDLPPRKCSFLGRPKDDFFIDTGIDGEDGRVYLSRTAMLEFAKISGLVPRDQYLAQLKNNESLIADCRLLVEENNQLRTLLNDVADFNRELNRNDIVERLTLIDAEIEQQRALESDRVDETVVESREADEQRSPESSNVEGLADLRSTSGKQLKLGTNPAF